VRVEIIEPEYYRLIDDPIVLWCAWREADVTRLDHQLLHRRDRSGDARRLRKVQPLARCHRRVVEYMAEDLSRNRIDRGAVCDQPLDAAVRRCRGGRNVDQAAAGLVQAAFPVRDLGSAA